MITFYKIKILFIIILYLVIIYFKYVPSHNNNFKYTNSIIFLKLQLDIIIFTYFRPSWNFIKLNQLWNFIVVSVLRGTFTTNHQFISNRKEKKTNPKASFLNFDLFLISYLKCF